MICNGKERSLKNNSTDFYETIGLRINFKLTQLMNQLDGIFVK